MDESYVREFISIGKTDRSIERYFRDLAGLAVLVKNLASCAPKRSIRDP